MSAPILLVAHQAHSDPGRVASELKQLGCALDLRRPSCGDDLPADLGAHAGVVIFGGPMSANDDHLPFMRAERDLIERALAAGKPYLGICLGGQMLARHLGGRVGPHAEGYHEIGYYPVEPTAAGRDLFDPGFHAYEWHREGFDLPRGAVLLATGRHFPHQAFRYGDAAFGLQFHPEVTPAIMERWAKEATDKLTLPGAQPLAEQLPLRERFEPAIERWLNRFLRRWLRRDQAAEPLLAAAE
ncbi:MAG TPA: gamma-glutamyl-gamma-aminobutyrate hydrolase family protein [Candidatus Sulfotelmatobacter sp.]|nr:gamma-glutamyl-gamma-aminobutyrate hydrolase family protein [Candidatus Sulfotelmatobacter sp.]